jgi:hypothetical protein
MCLAIFFSTELSQTVDICHPLKAKSTRMLVCINLTERKNALNKEYQQKILEALRMYLKHELLRCKWRISMLLPIIYTVLVEEWIEVVLIALSIFLTFGVFSFYQISVICFITYKPSCILIISSFSSSIFPFSIFSSVHFFATFSSFYDFR